MIDATADCVAISEAVRRRVVRASDLVEACIARCRAANPRLNAFTEVTAERARAEAAAVDRTLEAGGDPGPLAGVPYAVKNLFDVEGLVTRAGARITRDDPPAQRDATAVHRLREAGAVLVGTLNMGEFAYDFTGENAHDGPSRNPLDTQRMSGGSSGGSAAAVTAGLVPLALGTDTNGSIRVPASLCGVFGLKPTFGHVSRAGTFPFVASLDHVGPLARSPRDLALIYRVIGGPDPRDPVSREIDSGACGLEAFDAAAPRVAVADDYFDVSDLPEAARAVAAVAGALEAGDRSVTVPDAWRARAAAYVITAVEGAQVHAANLRSRAGAFDPDVRDRLLAGATVPASWYVRAQRFRRHYVERVSALFESVDVIVAPATPCVAPLLGQKTLIVGDAEVPLRPNLGLYTQPISFAGLPVVAVPMDTGTALPIGVQLIGPPGSEATLVAAAERLLRLGILHDPDDGIDVAPAGSVENRPVAQRTAEGD
jgi:aspartyl-tRNA(Asn)/glutamyl-tRNA(Gln) amidotransferase subunit A